MGTRSFILHGMFGKVSCLLLIAAANAAVVQEKDDLRDSCGQCLMVKSTKSSVSAVFPWLFTKLSSTTPTWTGRITACTRLTLATKRTFFISTMRESSTMDFGW